MNALAPAALLLGLASATSAEGAWVLWPESTVSYFARAFSHHTQQSKIFGPTRRGTTVMARRSSIRTMNTLTVCRRRLLVGDVWSS